MYTHGKSSPLNTNHIERHSVYGNRFVLHLVLRTVGNVVVQVDNIRRIDNTIFIKVTFLRLYHPASTLSITPVTCGNEA